jgi:hypothetical protein
MPIGDIVGKSEVSFSQDGDPRDSWMGYKCCYELKFKGMWAIEVDAAGTGHIMRLQGDFTEKCWDIKKNQNCAFGTPCAYITGFGGFVHLGKVCLTVQKSKSLSLFPCNCESKGYLNRTWIVSDNSGSDIEWNENGSEEDLQLLFTNAIFDFAECGPNNGCF